MHTKAKLSLILLTFLTFTILVGPVSAGEGGYNAAEDSYVCEGAPSKNYGDSGSLYVQSGSTAEVPGDARTYLKFNLPVHPTQIINATLKMYVRDASASGRTYVISLVTEDWSESEITWNNQPATGTEKTVDAPSATGWWQTDITDIVIYSQTSTVSIAIKDSAEDSATAYYTEFYSSESENPPQLIISYRAYGYLINGPYYENGTLASSIQALVVLENGSSEEFTLTEPATHVAYDSKPIFFVWMPSGGGERYWYVRQDYGNITCYIPYDNYQLYSFTIKDYAGVLSDNTFLEARSYVSGSRQTIERKVANGKTSSVQLLLQIGRSYEIYLVGSDFEYSFGLFLANGTGMTLTVGAIEFSPRVKLTYRYVRVEASRPDATTIIVNYEDTLQNTTITHLYIKLRNGTQVYYANSTANKVQYQWTEANNTTDYFIELQIVHGELGTFWYKQALPAFPKQTLPFDLSGLGNWLIPGTQIFPICLILIVAAVFSSLNSGAGAVITCLFAGIIWYIGWLNATGLIIAVALGLSILYAFGRGAKKYD